MTRQGFINTLFNNGNGLTLAHIRQIEDALTDTIPYGMIDDLMTDNGMTVQEATKTALLSARDIFMNTLHDCADMLEIDDFMVGNYHITLTDKEIYTLYYLR